MRSAAVFSSRAARGRRARRRHGRAFAPRVQRTRRTAQVARSRARSFGPRRRIERAPVFALHAGRVH
jgi:hypothetical protein